MQSLEITIQNENGLHARPGAQFVKACKAFSSHIVIENKGKQVNAKSLIKLLGAGICQHDNIRVMATGEDEAEAIQYLSAVIQRLVD